MNGRHDHFESVYWVFTQLCNDRCAHCYNDSGPQGARISTEECLQIVANLPSRIDRLILSGGVCSRAWPGRRWSRNSTKVMPMQSASLWGCRVSMVSSALSRWKTSVYGATTSSRIIST